ncbi:MAG: PQQ-binding-like beta-propeller repeat protein [Clostridiaceae bacterium]|nr:PQQ-binding-like beta-propeller repeat protein [Clostridiaceae bacterium]
MLKSRTWIIGKFLIISFTMSYGQVEFKPIEDLFEVIWMDTIKIKGSQGEPMINGKLIIPPYGNDGCYLAETGEILYYTFLPHQKIIKSNLSSRYVLFKTESHNIIFDIISGKEVYDNFYKIVEDRTRNPYIHKNRIIESRYVCFATSISTFTCVDTLTMREKWSFTSEAELFDDYLEYEGIIYLGSDKYLYAIELETGMTKWSLEVGKLLTNLIIIDGHIYGFYKAKGVVAVELQSGKIIFTSDRVGLFLDAKKLIDKSDTLFVMDSRLYALNINNAEWLYIADEFDACSNESYFVYGNHIISQICSWSENYYALVAFNKRTGKIVYKVSDEENIDPMLNQFLGDAVHFSHLRDNMIFSTSRQQLKDGFWMARIYGVRIKSTE